MKRPLTVTLIGILFIVAGVTGIVYHASELKYMFERREEILIFSVRLLAIIGGVFTLRGSNLARWLLVVWMSYHVVLSFYHTPVEIGVHVGFLVVVLLGLFNRSANAYFKK